MDIVTSDDRQTDALMNARALVLHDLEVTSAANPRSVSALENPYVSALSHPSGRYIGRRPPNAVDIEVVLETARKHGKAVETNGLPDRLDLSGPEVKLAVEAGVPICASTDAHSVRGLGNMRLSIATARRGWATAADVLNTRGLDEVLGRRR